jgi:hypothetical protein
MQGSRRRFRRAFFGGAIAVAAAAALVAGVTTSALSAQPKTTAGHHQFPRGYPPPGGIYTGMTRCPLFDQLMHESVQFTACVLGDATSGSITLGNITTPVVEPVNVQFGFYTAANQNFYADVVPPPEGLSAQLVTRPDPIPETLSTALGCATTTSTVIESLCQRAQHLGKFGEDVYALAESDGAITNFDLLSWTQPVVFQLINPVLGPQCTIGTLGDPVLLHPALSISSAKIENDPNPTEHPDTFVLASQATASDTTFTAPGVTGCGPGGVANIAVDEALDASSGLPAASGVNSLTLTGDFNIAACEASEDSSLTQPQDDAQILLSAFLASVGTPPPSASKAAAGRLSAAELKQALRRLDVR